MGYGQKAAHGPPQASAAAIAPQVLMSKKTASGRSASMAALRSVTSWAARAANTVVERAIEPAGLLAR